MSPNSNLVKKLPPQSMEAERALLGACLLDKAAANSVQGIVSPPDFYAESHRLIFAVICQMVTENQPCDPVTVSDALKVNGDLERIGGVSYISSLLDSVPAPSAAVYYARMISDKAHTRALMETASSVLAKGYEGSFNAEELQNYAESAIFDVVQRRQNQQLHLLRDLMQPVL
ncbi:MAG: replicative DNA helicase, partial [Clostridia bacterium]|nr:replicative DNA helicase [Clostridia bacterium]